VYGPRLPPDLTKAAALRCDRQFGRTSLLAVQLLSGVARSRSNWNFHKHDLHYINSGVRSDELLAVRRDIFGKKLVATIEPARNSCLALVLQHSRCFASMSFLAWRMR